MNSVLHLRLKKIETKDRKPKTHYFVMRTGELMGVVESFTLQYRRSEIWHDVPVEGDEDGIPLSIR